MPDIGAGFSAYINGELIIDIVAGHADPARTTLYRKDSLTPIFSSGKAVMAIVVASLVSKGLLKYEDPIAKYWPEFAAGGKEKVTVSDVLAHVGGVAYLDPEWMPSIEEMMDLDTLASKIAGQPHNFAGERKVTYHAAMGGCFLNEVVRRVDPKKRSCGVILREDIMPLLDSTHDGKAEIYCGLPATVDMARLATMRGYPRNRLIARAVLPGWLTGSPIPAELLAMRSDAGLMKALGSIPKVTGPGLLEGGGQELFKPEGSSYAMLSNASSLAKLASVMALGGLPLVSAETFKEAHSDLQPSPMMCLGRKMTVGGLGRIDKAAPVVFDGFENPSGNGYEYYGWYGYFPGRRVLESQTD